MAQRKRRIEAQRLAVALEEQLRASSQKPRIFDYDTEKWRDMTSWEISRAQRYLARTARRKAWQDEQDRLLNEATKINAKKAKGSASQQRRAAEDTLVTTGPLPAI